MRRIFLTILVFFSFFYGYAYAENDEIEEEKGPYFWDFGKVNEGEVFEHAFTVKNDTHVTLHIESISTSCGCTTSEVKEKEIAPGKSVEVQVKFNTKGYSGVKKRYVYIKTKQRDRPTIIKLIIKADIQPKLPSR